ncbi:histidine kinase [Nocardioides sp. JQ2195]|uniref:sensor histidine kinase n=1 Tax=Nocardioides sp. JQ2195 TaxID=2592334 RepID=UPI00143E4D5D|nr:histidine kinase [Nocardioides sp. JQ2195]QIX26020.1 histidine kinase [Nocardioides sp. JQ2195]
MPQTASPSQPPLTRWGSFWRYAGCLAIAGLVWPTYLDARDNNTGAVFVIDVVMGLASFAVLFLRRRQPVTIGVVTGLMAGFSPLAAGPATLAAVSVATSRRWRPVIVVGLAQWLGAEMLLYYQPVDDGLPGWISSAINLVVISACMGWGMFIGSRRELLWTLRERAERAEAEQELRAGKARGDERSRIAREMHDLLAHRISQVSMHAGALAFRDDLTAEQMRSSAGVIQEQANLALTDLRAVLGVLRDPETGELLDKPQPTYTDILDLVEEARAGGMQVEYDAILADGEPVPDQIGRTLFRIVQEGLTNARKHAPGTTVFVHVSGSLQDGVTLLMRNPLGFGPKPETPRSGLGLIGLAERAELVGGRLEHGRDGSMFVLHTWIPWAP